MAILNKNLTTTIRKTTNLDIPYILMIEKLADISNVLKGRSKDSIEKLIYNDYSESKAYFENKLMNFNSYVVEYENSIMGCGFYKEFDKYIEIQTVYIEPSFQNKGIGTKLLNFFIGEARVLGKEFVELETETAQLFYHKLGFVEVPNTFKMVKTLNKN